MEKPRVRVNKNGLVLRDGYANVVAQLGTDRDKSAFGFYANSLDTSLEYANMYRNSWAARKLIDIPVDDALRNWRSWNADKEDITKLEDLEKDLRLQKVLKQGMKRARLFGGALIYISLSDDNPEAPVNPEAPGGLRINRLIPVNKADMEVRDWVSDSSSPFYGKPEFLRFRKTGQYGKWIHVSRFIFLFGVDVLGMGQSTSYGQEGPLRRGIFSTNTDFWGDSVLQSTADTIKNADSSAASAAALVFEAKVDVIKIPNLMATIGDLEMEQALVRRMQLVSVAKGTNGTIIMDSEEDYVQRTSSALSSLTSIIESSYGMVAAAGDIPITRFMAQSPGGMNSTGESDIRNYYDMVRGIQADLEEELTIFDALLRNQALGTPTPVRKEKPTRKISQKDDSVYFEWRSLWQATDSEKHDIGKKIVEIGKSLKDMGLFSEEVIQESVSNALIESGCMPGLEAAIEEFGLEIPEEEEVDLEAAAEVLAKPEKPSNVIPLRKKKVGDAAPRTLYVRRQVKNAAEIMKHYEDQGVTDLTSADDLHVTVIYSKQPLDWTKTYDDNFSEMKIQKGGMRMHETFGDRVGVLLFLSSWLSYRHHEFREAGASFDYDEYQPHITISGQPIPANVEPWRGEILLEEEIWEEIKPRIMDEE